MQDVKFDATPCEDTLDAILTGVNETIDALAHDAVGYAHVASEWTIPGLTIGRTHRLLTLLAVLALFGLVWVCAMHRYSKRLTDVWYKPRIQMQTLRLFKQTAKQLLPHPQQAPPPPPRRPNEPPPPASMAAFFSRKPRKNKRVIVQPAPAPAFATRSAPEQQGYAPLLDDTDELSSFTAATRHDEMRDKAAEQQDDMAAMRRPLNDMIMVWPVQLEPKDDEAEKERQRMLDLVSERLFVQKLEEPPVGAVESCCSSGDAAPRTIIYKLSMRPFNDDDEGRLKARRIQRLFCRLATRERMPKQLRKEAWLDKDAWHAFGQWDPKRSEKWVDEAGESNESRGYPSVPPSDELKPRHIVPFDERLQPFIDPCPKYKAGTRDREDRIELKNLVFEPAPLDEWVSHDIELFTSRERIHLMFLMLQERVDKGGCGINVHRAEEKKWFTAVPIHDGNRTKTKSYPDAEDSPAESRIESRVRAGESRIERVQAGTKEIVGRVRTMTVDFVQHVAQEGSERLANALKEEKLSAKVRALFRTTKRIDEVYEGTLMLTFAYRGGGSAVPLDDVRDYFGVEIALYFAFLEFLSDYMVWLGPLGLVPMLGWVIYDTLDNPTASVYSLVALVWCFLFAKRWKRYNRELSYRWNTESADDDQGTRFQFHDEEKENATNGSGGFYSKDDYFIPAGGARGSTGDETPKKMDREIRVWRVLGAWLIVGLFMLLSFLVMVLILSFRVFLMTIFFDLPSFGPDLQWLYDVRVYLGSGIAVILSVLWTSISNIIGRTVATKLTEWEQWRKQVDHETALLLKKFAITFVNSYSGLLYIAFFKATPAGALLGFAFAWFDYWFTSLGWVAANDDLLLLRDYCHDMSNFTRSADEILASHNGDNPYCMGELSAFLASTISIYFVYLMLDIFMLPLKYHVKSYFSSRKQQRFYERQAQLESWEGATDACIPLVIQIGYVVLFAPAFPIAAFFIALVNIIKQRADAYNLLKLHRRALPHKVTTLFGLHDMLTAIGAAGVLTNTGLLFFTATQLTALLRELPHMLQQLRESLGGIVQPSDASSDYGRHIFLLFVLTEHVMIIVFYFIHGQDDDTPELNRMREWSERFEPKFLERVLQKPKVEPHQSKFTTIGPFSLLKVPDSTWKTSKATNKAFMSWYPGSNNEKGSRRTATATMGFKLEEGKWSIGHDQSWLLSGVIDQERQRLQKSRGHVPATASEQQATRGEDGSFWGLVRAAYGKVHERPLYGRVSEKSGLTLTPVLREHLGIPDNARRCCWAYPLRSFVDYEERLESDLDVDLELQLHNAVDKQALSMEPRCARCLPHEYPDEGCPDCARELALRFLAVGGFIYLDVNDKEVMLSTLTISSDKRGLRFNKPLVSESYSGKENLDSYYMQIIGKRLRERSEFCSPTLQFLKDRGVEGFCWLAPSEVFAGLTAPTKASSGKWAAKHLAERVGLFDHKAIAALDELEEGKLEAERMSNKHWRSGAFVYMFGSTGSKQPDDNALGRFYLFGVDAVNLTDHVQFNKQKAAKTVQHRWRAKMKGVGNVVFAAQHLQKAGTTVITANRFADPTDEHDLRPRARSAGESISGRS